MLDKEYKTISARCLEHIAEDLNQLKEKGWVIAAYTQEFGVTKLLLERDAQQEKEI